MGALHFHKFTVPFHSGKPVAPDNLLSRPLPTSNGYGPHSEYYRLGNDITPPLVADVTPSAYVAAPRSSSLRLPGYGGYRKRADYSYSTLGPESGFSSKASSSFDNANHSSSAPSTPETMIRRKPPPKPPRMRTSMDTLLRTPTMSVRSAGVSTLKSSIADVTNALDCALWPSPVESDGLVREGATSRASGERCDMSSVAQEKVCSILEQTKQFLAFELDPESVVDFLVDRRVISRQNAVDIRSRPTEHARCEALIDIITEQGRDELLTFCETLRHVGSLGYLADFLQVLDNLVELATTANTMRPLDRATWSPHLRVRTFSFEGDRKCNTCSCNNNNNCDDEQTPTSGATLNDEPNFDIDISYINRATEERRSVSEVSAMKRRKLPLSVTADDLVLLEEADRYIPVISASLYNQCLKHGGIDVLSGLLADYPCIRELSLVKNHLNADSMKALARGLEQNRGLAQLDIRLNQIGDRGAERLSRVLGRHASLRTLRLTSTGLTGVGCGFLIGALARSQRLSELDIGFNELSEAACEAMARCLAGNPALRRLRLRGNGITPYGARCIFKSLRRNSRLRHLDIGRNQINDESLAVLCDVLLSNRTLCEINMENCNVTGEGCSGMSRALKTNTSLRHLDLSMNNLGNAGASALAEGLKYNKSLQTLCLNMCSISNNGFMRMLNALRHNTTMSTLKLCYNNIGKLRSAEPLARRRRDTEYVDRVRTPNQQPIPDQTSPSSADAIARKTKSDLVDTSPERTVACRPSSLVLPGSNREVPGSGLEHGSFAISSSSSPNCSQTGSSALSTSSFTSVSHSFLARSASDTPHLTSSPSPTGLSPTSPVLSNSPPRLSFGSAAPSPKSAAMLPSSAPVTPSTPTSPTSPLMASLRLSFTGSRTSAADTLDQLYETLCEVLQQNKHLKVLLWGNNFDDAHDDDAISIATTIEAS